MPTSQTFTRFDSFLHTLFEKTPILQAFQANESHGLLRGDAKQLILFEF